MSELYEFSAEEMKGCPSFEYSPHIVFRRVVKGRVETTNTLINKSYSWSKIQCNPHDRMRAIAKHLFELMPEMNEIYISIKELPIIREGDSAITSSMIELSINPFIGLERTEITREEVIND